MVASKVAAASACIEARGSKASAPVSRGALNTTCPIISLSTTVVSFVDKVNTAPVVVKPFCISNIEEGVAVPMPIQIGRAHV